MGKLTFVLQRSRVSFQFKLFFTRLRSYFRNFRGQMLKTGLQNSNSTNLLPLVNDNRTLVSMQRGALKYLCTNVIAIIEDWGRGGRYFYNDGLIVHIKAARITASLLITKMIHYSGVQCLHTEGSGKVHVWTQRLDNIADLFGTFWNLSKGETPTKQTELEAQPAFCQWHRVCLQVQRRAKPRALHRPILRKL